MIRLFSTIYTLRRPFLTMVYSNINNPITATRIGWLWWFIDPVITMCIYYFLVSIVLGRGGPGFHLFALTGIVFWRFFSSNWQGTMTSLRRSMGLIKQTNLSLEVCIFYNSFVQLFYGTLGLAIVAFWNFPALGLHTFMVFPLLFFTALISFTLGLYFMVIEAYLADITKIMSYILRMGFFLTPILFDPSRVLGNPRVPHIAKLVFKANPMTSVIPAAREVLMEGKVYSLRPFVLWLVVTLVFMQIGLLLVRKMAPKMMKRL